MTTPDEVVSRMLELAQIEKGDVLDLGSGDGRIVVAAAKKYGIRAGGFEIDPALVKDSRQVIRQAGLEEFAGISASQSSCERRRVVLQLHGTKHEQKPITKA